MLELLENWDVEADDQETAEIKIAEMMLDRRSVVSSLGWRTSATSAGVHNRRRRHTPPPAGRSFAA